MRGSRNGFWRSPARLVGAAALIALVFFGVHTAALVMVWAIGLSLGQTWDLWAMMEGVSSAAMLAISVGGGLVVLYELSEASESRNLAGFSDAFRALMTPEQIEARRWIYGLPDDIAEIRREIHSCPENHERLKEVLNLLDYLGFLVSQGWIEADEVVGWLSPVVVKTWDKIGPLVKQDAEDRNEPDYYISARRLAKRCRAYRDRHFRDARWRWVDDAL